MRNRILIGLIPILLLAAPALAQQQEAEQEIEVAAREIVFVEGDLPLVPDSNTIVTKLPLDLARTPNNVGIVLRGLFDEQNAQVLGDALENVSNVNVQPGFGVHDFFVIRGFDSLSSALVLTDGAPEPEATFYQLYNVERVEVLKGPAGFLYGSNPLAGAVNLVRKQPLQLQHLRVGATAGSFSTFEGTLDGNTATADGSFLGRLNGMIRDAGSWRGGKDSTVIGFNPSATWIPNESHSLNLNLEYLRSEQSPDAGIPLLLDQTAPVDGDADFNSPLDFSDQDVLRFQADWEGRISDSVTLRNKLYYRGLDWDSDGTLLLGVVPTPTGRFAVLRTQIQLQDDQDFFGNQLEAVVGGQTGGVRHDLLIGLETTRFGDRFSLDVGGLPPIDLLDPIDSGVRAVPIPGQAVAGEPRSRVIAPYVVDQISLSDSFQILAGVRFDSIDFEDELTGRERDDSELSPMLGAAWLPVPDVTVYGNFSRSFAPPSPRAFGELEPEESEQLEAGVKVRFLGNRGTATAAVYHLERENIAIPDDNGFTQQIGNQRSRGFELEMAAELGDGFRAVASYAYNDAELTDFAERVLFPDPLSGELVPVVLDRSGNRPAFAPEHLFDVWASKSLASGLGVGLGGRYIGSQFIAENNLFRIDEAFLLSASAYWEFRDAILSVNVENITGEDWLTRGFGSQSVIPGSPVAAFVRLAYRP